MTAILLLGAGGQLGREIADRAAGFGIRLVPRSHQQTDITDAAMVRDALATAAPDLVVNAAAYTDVDRAEIEPDAAFRANAVAPGVLAEACATARVPLIHLSTDYVFDGTKESAYGEDDAIAPLNIYGMSKAVGEGAVRRACPRHLILRTSWVFGRHGSNFVKSVLKAAGERARISMVSDQRGCPTAAADIAEAIFTAAPLLAKSNALWGTYHFAGSGVTSWYGFAQEIVNRRANATGQVPQVLPISTADYPTRARRPLNSELDSNKFATAFHFRAKAWQQRVHEVVDSLIAEGHA